MINNELPSAVAFIAINRKSKPPFASLEYVISSKTASDDLVCIIFGQKPFSEGHMTQSSISAISERPVITTKEKDNCINMPTTN